MTQIISNTSLDVTWTSTKKQETETAIFVFNDLIMLLIHPHDSSSSDQKEPASDR